MKKILFAVCAWSLVTLGCAKKDTKDPGTVSGTYSFMLGDKQYQGVAGATFNTGTDGYTLGIAGGTADLSNSFGIAIIEMTEKKTGVYTDATFTFSPVPVGDPEKAYLGSVTVTIAKLSSHYMEGTFSGNAGTQEGQQAEITNGSFKVPVL